MTVPVDLNPLRTRGVRNEESPFILHKEFAMFTFPGIRIGDPIRHKSLTVFPLFTQTNGPVDYLLSDEAIQSGAVTVQEVSEGGSVPELLVENLTL